MNERVNEVKEYCQRYLSSDRYRHVERVYQTMIEINALHGLGIEAEQLALTGFGHDIARELPGEVSALLLEQSDIELESWEQEFKLFCHNKSGTLILQKCFRIYNDEVLQAVEHHTLGNAGLGRLGKLLYVADFLEPNRPFLKENERETYIAMDLDRIVYEVCHRTSKFLQDSGKPLLPPTQAMMQELAKKFSRETSEASFEKISLINR